MFLRLDVVSGKSLCSGRITAHPEITANQHPREVLPK
jgi:hypothetical protein